jgi:phage tail sheath protein FI
MKTPGVYIVEKDAFPNSVVEVATAVPAFIGYTEKADNAGMSLQNKPWPITSMAEFHQYFGGGPHPLFEIKPYVAPKNGEAPTEPDFTVKDKQYVLNQSGQNFMLYRCMKLFFNNGGGSCYIVSIGSYKDTIDAGKMTTGVDQLIKEQEPTMVIIPEAMQLPRDDCSSLQQYVLNHCGLKMKNRFAILDVHEGFKDRMDPPKDVIAEFRDSIGINCLDFAAAYYPWLNTTIVEPGDLSYLNFKDSKALQDILRLENEIVVQVKKEGPKEKSEVKDSDFDPKKEQLKNKISLIAEDLSAQDQLQLNKTLMQVSPVFKAMITAAKNKLNLLPPSAAMAGIYTMVDSTRGVWKAPANVSLTSVVSPAVNIGHDDQEDLNVDINGKSINVIRSFIGKGVLVWGARTLDGNSLDWRYINVRRTLIMLEESIKQAAKAYVFEDNVATTWVTIKSMIRNFLTGIWKRGGLAGAVPQDAFSVFVGLGETMTPEDILEGILRVTVLVAVTRPAEFIEITFQQQMQKS